MAIDTSAWNDTQLDPLSPPPEDFDGLSVDDAQMVVMNAIGGDNVTTTVEGRERYPVNVRYMRDFRSDMDRLGRVLVPAMGGQQQIPLAQIADLTLVSGPAMLRNENGLLNGYVFVDVTGRDVGSYVDEAKRVVREKVQLPPGYSLTWSGQYEAMERVRERLKLVVPLTLFLVFLLLFLNTKSVAKTMLILLAVPFSAVGAIWLLYVLHEHRRVGGADRADGRGRGDRRVHAAVSGPGVRPVARRGAHAQPARFAGSHPARRGQAHSAQVHDRGHHVRGSGADHVVGRRGRRCDEAHRGAHDRRHLYIVHFGVGGLSGHLRGLEMAFTSKKATRLIVAAVLSAAAALPAEIRFEARYKEASRNYDG